MMGHKSMVYLACLLLMLDSAFCMRSLFQQKMLMHGKEAMLHQIKQNMDNKATLRNKRALNLDGSYNDDCCKECCSQQWEDDDDYDHEYDYAYGE